MIKKHLIGLGLFIISIVVLLGQVTTGLLVGMPVIWVVGCIIGFFIIYVCCFSKRENQIFWYIIMAFIVKIYLIALMLYYLYIFASHLFN